MNTPRIITSLAAPLAACATIITTVAPMLTVSVGVVGVASLAGCNKPKPPPPPPPPPPPVRREPDRPEPANIAGVMASIGADERVQFPQERAPENEDLAKAVAQFAGALAKGSSREFGSFLDDSSRPILDDLVADGRWDDGTSQIEAVRVVHMTTMMTERDGAMVVNAAQFVLAIQEPGEAYTLGWRAAKEGDAWQFEAVPTSDATKARANEWDADSMVAFTSDTGPAASRRGPLASGRDVPPIVTYCAIEITNRLIAEAGLPPDQQAMATQSAMAQLGAEGPAKFEEGKTLYQSGTRPSEAEAEPIYTGIAVASQLFAMIPGSTLTNDRVASIIADVLGVDLATAKAKLAAASAAAPDITNMIPPGMRPPGNDPPAPRPGTTRRNTPAGPIDIPTETPSSDPGGG